eukprot:364631-Chlamydomonas_euryale.AAC.25
MAGYTPDTGDYFYCQAGASEGSCQAYADGPFADADCDQQCTVLPRTISPCNITYGCTPGRCAGRWCIAEVTVKGSRVMVFPALKVRAEGSMVAASRPP